jgi:hypothetical protein
LNIELKKDSCLSLHIENICPDTLVLRSSFFVDDPSKLSYLLIYYCQKEDLEADTMNCDYGYATQSQVPPVIFEFFNRKVVIPPNSKIYFPLSIPSYSNAKVFLKIQMIVLVKGNIFYVRKISNSVRI